MVKNRNAIPKRPYISFEIKIKYSKIIKLGKRKETVMALKIAANVTLKKGAWRQSIIFINNIATILLNPLSFKFKIVSPHQLYLSAI